MVNQIPAIINTNPPEPKSSDPELTEVKLDVISCIPSNNFGKEQFEIEAKVEEVKKTIKMDGFRPGKVPSNIIMQKHGDAINAEVLNKMVNL